MGSFPFLRVCFCCFYGKKQKELEHKTENTIISSWVDFFNDDTETSSSPPRPVWLRCWQLGVWGQGWQEGSLAEC